MLMQTKSESALEYLCRLPNVTNTFVTSAYLYQVRQGRITNV